MTSTVISEALVDIYASLGPGSSVSSVPCLTHTLVRAHQVGALRVGVTVAAWYSAFVQVLTGLSVPGVSVGTGALEATHCVLTERLRVAVALSVRAFVHIRTGAAVALVTWFTSARMRTDMVLAGCVFVTLIAKLAFIDTSAIESIALESIKASAGKGSWGIPASSLWTAWVLSGALVDLHARLSVAEVSFFTFALVSPLQVDAFGVGVASVSV